MRAGTGLLVLCFSLHAQTGALFRGGVTQVRVDAQVMQGDRLVTGLHKEDFVIYDGGQEQKIIAFAEDSEPLDLILLLDTSGSMRRNIQDVSRSAWTALKHLKPGDRVAVWRFTTRPRMVLDFSEDLSTVADSILEVAMSEFRGGTNIHGALEGSAQNLIEQPRSEHRRAVLLISDGEAPRYKGPRPALHALWEADAVMHAIVVRTEHPGKTKVNVRELALQTGGDVLLSADAGKAFAEMMERIRRRYSIYYALPPGRDGEERKVKVELSSEGRKQAPKARIKARKGYVWRAAVEEIPTVSAASKSLRSSPTVP